MEDSLRQRDALYSLAVKSIDVLRARVQDLMHQRKWRQADLARAVGKSTGWASTFLAGRKGTPLDTIDLLAATFDVTPAELLRPRVQVLSHPADESARPPDNSKAEAGHMAQDERYRKSLLGQLDSFAHYPDEVRERLIVAFLGEVELAAQRVKTQYRDLPKTGEHERG